MITRTGTVESIRDEGTLVIVTLREANGWPTIAIFDHRQFQHLVDAEDGKVLGRSASFDGSLFSFDDEAEE